MSSYARKKPRASRRKRKTEPEETKKRRKRPKAPVKKRRVVRKKTPPKKRRVVRKKAPPKKKRRVVRKKTPPKKREVARKKRRVVRKKKPPKKRKVTRKPAKRIARKPLPRQRKIADPRVVARKKLREAVANAKKQKKLRKRPRLPKRMRKSARVAGGEQRLVYVGQVITPENVEEIIYRIENVVASMSGAFELWLASLELSALGSKIIGYGQHLVNLADLEDEEGRIFQMQAFDSTGVWGSTEGMLDRLSVMLDEYSSERTTAILLSYVKIMNFDRR